MKSYASFFLIIAAFLLSLGCSREDTIYPEPVSPVATPPISPSSTSPSLLPEGFYDQSVGLAKVDLQPDGISSHSKSIRLKITPGANSPGGFNSGDGVGSKSILGYDVWEKPLSDIFPLGHDGQTVSGTEKINLGIQVDLKCDQSEVYLLVATSARLTPYTSSPDSLGYSRTEVDPSDPVWAVEASSGQPLKDPDTDTVLIKALELASDPSPSPHGSSLNALLLRYPSACISNARAETLQARETPKGAPTAGIQWTLGRDNTSSANAAFIHRLRVGTSIFEELE